MMKMDRYPDSTFDIYTPPMSPLHKALPVSSAAEMNPIHIEAAARYLSHLLPNDVSSKPPSTPLIKTYLTCANLSAPTLALAACILDSLSGFFARAWKKRLFSASVASSSSSSSTPTSAAGFTTTHWRKAPPQPELIIIAACFISRTFLEDGELDLAWWSQYARQGALEAKLLNVTAACVLEDLGYDLARFAAEDVEEVMAEMFEGRRGSLALSEGEAGYAKARRRSSLAVQPFTPLGEESP